MLQSFSGSSKARLAVTVLLCETFRSRSERSTMAVLRGWVGLITTGQATEKSGGLGNVMIGSLPGPACWNGDNAFCWSCTSGAVARVFLPLTILPCTSGVLLVFCRWPQRLPASMKQSGQFLLLGGNRSRIRQIDRLPRVLLQVVELFDQRFGELPFGVAIALGAQ